VHGHLAAPPLPKNRQAGRTAAFATAVLGIIYPLTGLTMLLVLLMDRIVRQRPVKASARSV
jgi:uncharacterized iron-regulated membrane protein